MDIHFAWDEEKNSSNQKKHGISFEEAATVFYDDDALLKYVEAHSLDEERFVMLGMSKAKQSVCWLFVTASVWEVCCVSYLHERQPEERKVSIGSVFRRDAMKEEYDFSDAIKNPYSKRLKKQITININNETVAYFKAQSEEVGIPYQTLINLYLSDCAAHGRKLNLSWQ